MTRLPTLPRFALATGAVVVLALGLTACSKKIAAVDPRYLSPEGTPSTRARLVLTPDVVVPLSLYAGAGAIVVDDSLLTFPPADTLATNHVLEAYGYFFLHGSGYLTGQIFDQTPVSSYQILRRESGGGYRITEGFELAPTRRWLDTEWEGYGFVERPPSASYQPRTYLGRGTFSHHVTAESPLTNVAIIPPDRLGIIGFDYQNQLDRTIPAVRVPSDSVYMPPDSLFEMRWTPVS